MYVRWYNNGTAAKWMRTQVWLNREKCKIRDRNGNESQDETLLPKENVFLILWKYFSTREKIAWVQMWILGAIQQICTNVKAASQNDSHFVLSCLLLWQSYLSLQVKSEVGSNIPQYNHCFWATTEHGIKILQTALVTLDIIIEW